MSEYFLRIIPADPSFTPNSAAQHQTVEMLANMLGHDLPIEVIATDTVEFVDPGENFESIACPKCGKALQVDWWQTVMDAAYTRKFSNMMTQTPCCQSHVSLNELIYEWPAGFARFVIEIDLGARELTLSDVQLFDLSHVLGVEVKLIRARY